MHKCIFATRGKAFPFSTEFRQSVAELNTYLQLCHERIHPAVVKSNSKTPMHVVLGNEAGDADSMYCALVLAYQKFKGQPHSSECMSIPIFSFPRSDLALRTETKALFDLVDIHVSDLLFLEELELLKSQGRVQALTLVDHNVLASAHRSLASALVAIVDHHQDTGLYPSITESRSIAFDASKNQASVASCCTLIAEQCVNGHHSLSKIEATLLLSAMALDSAQYDPEMGKVTTRDLVMRDTLMPIVTTGENPDLDLETFGQWLAFEKHNLKYWTNFSVMQCLGVDYKAYHSNHSSSSSNVNVVYGISSVLIPIVPNLVDKMNQQDHVPNETLEAFCQEKQLAFHLLMSNAVVASGDSKYSRQLAVYTTRDPARLAHLRSVLESLESLELTLLHESSDMIIYRQGNVQLSRKRLQPLFHQGF